MPSTAAAVDRWSHNDLRTAPTLRLNSLKSLNVVRSARVKCAAMMNLFGTLAMTLCFTATSIARVRPLPPVLYVCRLSER